MNSGPGKLAGEDCRGCERERDVCDGMASDGNGNMEVDSVSVGGGATLTTAHSEPARMEFERLPMIEDSSEGQRSSGAGIGVAAADGTGRAGAEQNMATAGSTERQGFAALLKTRRCEPSPVTSLSTAALQRSSTSPCLRSAEWGEPWKNMNRMPLRKD